jgi:hypothetical protein
MSSDADATKGDALDSEAVAPPMNSEAAAVPADGDATTSDAAAVPADADASTATPATTVTTATPATTPAAPTDAASPADATAGVSPARRRGLAVLAGLTRLLRFAFVVAIFVGGLALGYQAFLLSEPQPTGVSAGGAVTATGEAPPVVRELIAAIGSNDADRIRSAVPADPYKSFTSEMARWEFQEVTSVETLATYVDGPRTATAFMMIGRDNAGNPIAINLVVETESGAIVGFK